jgi:hypothetical protein
MQTDSIRLVSLRPVTWLFLLLLLISALLPLLSGALLPDDLREAEAISQWPVTFEGRPLERLPLAATEERFAKQFPGRIAHFTDGQRDIIMREVRTPTRMLHPAADCFRGLGYTVQPAVVKLDREGVAWSCFTGAKGGQTREICERIHDGNGQNWTDVSAWYWAALLGRTHGPWRATTVATQSR